MKAQLLFGAIFVIIAFSIPMIALIGTAPAAVLHEIPQQIVTAPPQSKEPAASAAAPQAGAEEPVSAAEPAILPEREAEEQPYSEYGVLQFSILDRSTGRVNEIGVRDYVRGAVASEMPASFHTEALKAQAVAAHTYALYNHYFQQRSPDPTLNGADFSADPSKREGYMTEKKAREFYGDKADLYWSKICEAVDSVLPYVMEYEGEPIVAAYHAISAGRTEDASNVWIGTAPYLTPADDEGSLLAPGYETKTTLSTARVKSTLLASYPDMSLSGPPDTWFSEPMRSDSGYITEIEVGGIPLHGKDVRELFGLRSHDFTVERTAEGFAFIARGYGHGVGLSQYGADFLAREGYSFDEILEHFYTDIVIRQVDFEALG